MKEYILPEHLKIKPDIPSDWYLSEFEIEDRIKTLRKEIYHLQNSRKKQPYLVIKEKQGIKIFNGWKIIVLQKGVFRADYLYSLSNADVKELLEKFNLRGLRSLLNERLKK